MINLFRTYMLSKNRFVFDAAPLFYRIVIFTFFFLLIILASYKLGIEPYQTKIARNEKTLLDLQVEKKRLLHGSTNEIYVYKKQLVSNDESALFLAALTNLLSTVELVSLKKEDAVEYKPFFLHVFTLEFKSDYKTFLSVLKKLSGLHLLLLWQDVSYHVPAYPMADITISIGVLSQDKKWVTNVEKS